MIRLTLCFLVGIMCSVAGLLLIFHPQAIRAPVVYVLLLAAGWLLVERSVRVVR